MPNKLSHDNSLPNMGSMENLHDNLNEASSIDDQLVAEAYGQDVTERDKGFVTDDEDRVQSSSTKEKNQSDQEESEHMKSHLTLYNMGSEVKIAENDDQTTKNHSKSKS